MKKQIFLLIFFMTVLINLSIVVNSISGDVSLRGLKFNMNIANATEGSVPACVTPGTPYGINYYKSFDRYCKDNDGNVCGEEYECNKDSNSKTTCTSICCL